MQFSGPPAGEVTRLLKAWSAGDRQAQDALALLVYEELRRRAGAQLRRERQNHTLQPTALVHEAYMRLTAQRRVNWRSRNHFFALASQIMRRVLVDYARTRAAAKRPDQSQSIPLEVAVASIEPPACDLLLLDQALSELSDLDARQVRILELVYFGGLSETEVADEISASRSTVARELRSAKAWLFRRMTSGRSEDAT